MSRLTVTAKEAAEMAGYRSERQFRAAVKDGRAPAPLDAKTRPQIWSVAALTAWASGTDSGKVSESSYLDRRFGICGS